MSTTEQKRERIRLECERRGITIEQRGGQCYLLRGLGVDLVTTDLAVVAGGDLRPYLPPTHRHRGSL